MLFTLWSVSSWTVYLLCTSLISQQSAHCRLNARVARPPECSPFLRFGFPDNIRVRKLLCVHRTFGGEKIEGTITKNVYFIQQIFLTTPFVLKSLYSGILFFRRRAEFRLKPNLDYFYLRWTQHSTGYLCAKYGKDRNLWGNFTAEGCEAGTAPE